MTTSFSEHYLVILPVSRIAKHSDHDLRKRKKVDTFVKARITIIAILKITLDIFNVIKVFTFENISVQPGWLGSSPPGRRTRKLRISDSEITPVTLDDVQKSPWIQCNIWKEKINAMQTMISQ